MKTPKASFVLVLFLVVAATRLTAVSIGVSLGTSAPPATIGGYAMGAFTDSSATGSSTTAVSPPGTAPVTGDLTFDRALVHYRVDTSPPPDAWATWSHGYSGSVYHLEVFENFPDDETGAGTTAETLWLTLPSATKAFSLYIEPGTFGSAVFDILGWDDQPLSDPVAFLQQEIFGEGGARGYGFYTSDAASSLARISITGYGTWPDGFAIGEFAINHIPATGVPEGGVTAVMLSGAILLLAGLRRRIA
jgi:hypothetical protein